MILYLAFLTLLCITSADKKFNSNKTAGNNESSLLEHLKGGISKPFDKNLTVSFFNDRYTLNKTAINDTLIRIENTSLFLSNVIVTGCKIITGGKMDYSVIFEYSRFENSEIVIDSASNVTLVYSQFIMEHIGNEEPTHVIKVYNTEILFMTNTHFGTFENQSMHDNQYNTGHSEIKNSTYLGVKLENVCIAKFRGCTFTGIKADKSNGSAILLKNTEMLMVSCQLRFNIAKYGVIFGNHSVNITSQNSSFLFNFGKSGAVFYLINMASLTNYDSVFQNNSAREHGGVVHAMYDNTINNRGCLFQHNSAETGGGSVIWMQYNCQLINEQVFIASSTSPHMWLADGDSLMCYIVRMSRLIA